MTSVFGTTILGTVSTFLNARRGRGTKLLASESDPLPGPTLMTAFLCLALSAVLTLAFAKFTFPHGPNTLLLILYVSVPNS
jgi:hypothetical protein